jgi:transposase-like protein
MIPKIDQINNILFNEYNCINYLFDKNLIKQKTTCDICNSNLYIYKKTFRCINKNCRKSVSIYTDSLFSKNHILCNDIILLAYFWIAKIRFTNITTITKYCKETVCSYTKFFRELVIKSLDINDEILGGNGVIVEIDESKFSNFWVVGITERTGNKKCYFEVVNNRNYLTLFKFIRKHVRPGSTVYSDCWKGYNNLDKLNIKHIRINHSKQVSQQQKIRRIHTNTIEGTWNALKLSILKDKRRIGIIEPYLKEYSWRRKHKQNLWEAFLSCLKK